MYEQEKRTIKFALCYLLSNSDDESVLEHFEIVTGSEQPIKHGDYIQNILNKIESDN